MPAALEFDDGCKGKHVPDVLLTTVVLQFNERRTQA